MDLKTQTTLKLLWAAAEADRDRRTPDATQLLQQVAEGSVPGPLTVELVSELLKWGNQRERVGHFYTAASVGRFVASLVEGRSVTSVLDPTCGSGGLLQLVAAATGATVLHAVETDAGMHRIADALLGARAQVHRGDFLDVKDRLADRYDLIVGDLPLGATIPRERRERNEGPSAKELGEAVAYWSCRHLNKGGLAVLNVSDRIAASVDIRENINALGCAVSGAIQIPSGVMHGTRLSTHLLLIEPGEQGSIFAAELPEAEEQTPVIRENWRRRRRTGHPSLGSLVEPAAFHGYAAVEAASLLRELLKGSSTDPVSSADLFTEGPRRVDPEPGSQLDLDADEALIDFAGRVRLAGDQPFKTRNAYRARLNLDLVDPRFLQSWLASRLGQLTLQSVAASSSRLLVGSPRVLRAATYHLPDLPTQQAIEVLDRRLDVLAAQVSEARALVWEGRTATPELQERVELIGQEDADLFWLETLPYPLASILWRHRTSAGSAAERFPILQHFFEALAAFLSTIHLSAYLTDEDEWRAIQPRVLGGIERAGSSWEQASFGTWKTTHATLAKATRGFLKKAETQELAFKLYRCRDQAFLEAISDSNLASVFDRASNLRNRNSGHGGAIGAAGAAAIEEELQDLLQEVREAFGLRWRATELVQPGPATFQDGEHLYEMPRLMGTRSGFERVERSTSVAMEAGQLHLLGRDEPSALKLLPFFRMAASPRPTACYFFNRCDNGKIRFVSYHDEEAGDLVEGFGDTVQAISRVTTLPTLPGMEATP